MEVIYFYYKDKYLTSTCLCKYLFSIFEIFNRGLGSSPVDSTISKQSQILTGFNEPREVSTQTTQPLNL